MSTLVELIEIKKDSKGNYMLNTIYVNPNQIVFMQENRMIKQQLQEGKIGLGLNQNFTQFTDIRMNFSSYVSNYIKTEQNCQDLFSYGVDFDGLTLAFNNYLI